MKKILVIAAILVLAFTCQAAARTVLCIFTTPGDDNNLGQVSKVEIRYKTIRPAPGDTLNWWLNAAYVVENNPKAPGLIDTVEAVIGNQAHYFLAVALDEVGNRSGWGNLASITELDTIPPGRVMLIVVPK